MLNRATASRGAADERGAATGAHNSGAATADQGDRPLLPASRDGMAGGPGCPRTSSWCLRSCLWEEPVLVAANSRAAPSPDPVDLSAMTQIKSADIKVASNRWHTLGWRAEGSCFTVFFDGKELFSTGDKTFNAEVAPIDCGSCHSTSLRPRGGQIGRRRGGGVRITGHDFECASLRFCNCN